MAPIPMVSFFTGIFSLNNNTVRGEDEFLAAHIVGTVGQESA